jgi:prophage tail gpP-like protein
MSATSQQIVGPDDVSIVIGNRKIVGWETVAITRSAESFPNSFSLTAADQYPYDAGKQLIVPGANGEGKAGETVKVYIGADLVITGFTDRVTINTGPAQHTVTIQGRGICQDLVDCSIDVDGNADVQGSTIRASNTLDLAQKLCNAFKLKARSAVTDLGLPIKSFTFGLDETPYSILERVCRYAGYLMYEDETGTLVLDRVGTQEMASGFKMPGNVEAAQSSLSIDERCSQYIVLWTSVNDYAEISALPNHRGDAIDANMPRRRPRNIVLEGDGDVPDLGQRRAEWEMARRIGRSQAVSVTCDSWRDSKNKLWKPNWLAPIDMAAHKITGRKWIIGSVTFRKDGGGTHADLVLMPPAAFSIEPSNLHLWDREVQSALAPTQTPPPATAAPPATPTLEVQPK